MGEPPLVSVIMPIRNEARYIGRAVQAVLAQDYPADRLQVLVVDGMSDDGTRAEVLRAANGDARLALLANPAGIVPTALNIGIRAARGEVLVRVDGHAIIAPDYVRRCVETLAAVDADCVGGPIETIGESIAAGAIALAQSSPFGVGNALFRYARSAQYVDTLAFGAYRREAFERIGLFDEALVRNQDDEFNFRLTRAGGKIWLTPAIRSLYYSRSTLRGLWKQYAEYGFWKVRVIRKHGRPASVRHLIPAAFVLALVTALTISAAAQTGWPLGVVALPYLAANGAASFRLAARNDWRYLGWLPFAFGAIHVGYGVGFLRGMVQWRDSWQPNATIDLLQESPNS